MQSLKSAARRRGALMAASSFGVLSLMAMLPATVAMAPTKALAADECGISAMGLTATCPAVAIYPTGISYVGDTVQVVLDDTVDVSDGGVSLTGSTAVSLTSTVTAPDLWDLTINNTFGTGILLQGGNVTLDLTDQDSGDAPGTITGISGVLGVSNGSYNPLSGLIEDADVNLNTGNLSVIATDSSGVGVGGANFTDGDIYINTTGGSVSSAGLGVAGVTFGAGDLNISAGEVSGGVYSIFGQVTDGTLNINATGDLVGDVYSNATWGGSVNLNLAALDGDLYANAVLGGVNINSGTVSGNVYAASSYGDVNVAVSDVGGSVTATSMGSINVSTGSVGNGISATSAASSVTVNANGPVTGSVLAYAYYSDVSVTTSDVSGSVSAVSSSGGSASVTTYGAIGDGIVASADNSGSVTINASGPVANGVTATANGYGSVAITTTGDVTGGITGTSNGGSVVIVAGNVTGSGTPIVATSNGGDVSVTLNGAVTGDSGYLAEINAMGSATVGIGSGVTATQSDFDITAGNMLTINNGGTWTGAIDFTGYTSGHFNNASTWDAADITFTDGDDSFANSGTANFPGALTYDFMGGTDSLSNSGTMTAGDLTLTNLEMFDNSGTLTATSLTMDEATSFTNSGTLAVNSLSLDAAQTFTNSGTFVFGTTSGAGTLSLPSVTSLDNSGTIVFGGMQSDGQWISDGEANDRVVADGAAFTGNGTLLMDVDFSAGNQEDCSAATAGDCLSLVGGSTPAPSDPDASPYTTTIVLNSLNAGTGGLNRIVLVDVSGGTSTEGRFKLADDSPVDQSLFFYRLDYDAAAKQFALQGVAGRGIYEFPQVSTAAQDVWYSSTGTYFEREADLRNQMDADGPGAWLKVNHVVTNRQGMLSADSVDYDLERRQTTNNLIGGIDLLHGSGDGQAYAVGVTAGKLDSEVNFKTSNGSTDLEGVSYGAYATWLSQSFFVDGIIQGNKLDVDQHGDWNTGGFASGKVKSAGAQVEGGWRLPLNDGEAAIEPLASLSYVKTSFDDLALPGTAGTIKLDVAKSLRGSLGVRLSGDAHLGGMTLKLSGTGRVWDEFEGDNKSILESAGRTLALGDDFGGTFGELGIGLNLFSASNKVSGFFSTSIKFKDDYTSSDTGLGVRVQW